MAMRNKLCNEFRITEDLVWEPGMVFC